MMHKRFVFTVAVLVSALAVSLAGRAVAVTITIELPANNSMFKVGEQATFRAVLSNFGDHHYEWMWWFGDIQYVEGWSYGVGERQEGDPPVTIQGPHTFAVPCHDAAAIVWVAETTDEGTQHYSAEVRFSAIQADLMSVSFTSDHHVMTDGNFYTGGGQVFPKPDWVSGERNNPISQTAGTRLQMDVAVRVLPSGVPFTLEGRGEHSWCHFTQQDESTGDTQTVSMSAEADLQDGIAFLHDFPIGWVLSVDGMADLELGASGPHNAYLTLGIPSGEEPAVSRTHRLVEIASAAQDAHECTIKLFEGCGFDNAGHPAVPWLTVTPVLQDREKGDCLYTALAVNAFLQVLGVSPGSIVLCGPGGGHTGTAEAPITRGVADTHEPNHAHGADCPVEYLTYLDGVGNFNWYEAALCRSEKYYAAGTNQVCFDSPTDVMDACAHLSLWAHRWRDRNEELMTDACMDPGPYPEHDWWN